jgi:hypothetical protein
VSQNESMHISPSTCAASAGGSGTRAFGGPFAVKIEAVPSLEAKLNHSPRSLLAALRFGRIDDGRPSQRARRPFRPSKQFNNDRRYSHSAGEIDGHFVGLRHTASLNRSNRGSSTTQGQGTVEFFQDIPERD